MEKIIITCLALLLCGYLAIRLYKRIRKNKNKNKISFEKKYKDVGLPVITVNILNNSYDFILDTGANFNALDKSQFMRILSENNIEMDLSKIEDSESGITVTGVGGSQTNVKDVKMTLNISELEFEEIFTLIDIKEALHQHGRGVHQLCGVIGSDFFDRHNWQIDFKDLVVWIN